MYRRKSTSGQAYRWTEGCSLAGWRTFTLGTQLEGGRKEIERVEKGDRESHGLKMRKVKENQLFKEPDS